MYGHRSVLLVFGFVAVAGASTLWALHAASWAPLAIEAAMFAWTGCIALAGLLWQWQRIRELHRVNRRLALMLATTDHPAARARLTPSLRPRAPERVPTTEGLLELLKGTADRPVVQIP